MSNHYRHFKHLHIPDGWEQYWSKYPNGYSLMEALINWVGQVNDMVEVSNEVSDQITCLQRNFNALDKELRASWAGYKESTTKQYEDFRDEVHTIINNWIANIEPTIQNKVVQSLQLWLSDGTLADIINNDVFDMKANVEDVEAVQFELAKTEGVVPATKFFTQAELADIQKEVPLLDLSSKIQQYVDYMISIKNFGLYFPAGNYRFKNVDLKEHRWSVKGSNSGGAYVHQTTITVIGAMDAVAFTGVNRQISFENMRAQSEGTKADGLNVGFYNNTITNGAFITAKNMLVTGFSGIVFKGYDLIDSDFTRVRTTDNNITFHFTKNQWVRSTTITFDKVYAERNTKTFHVPDCSQSRMVDVIVEHSESVGDISNGSWTIDNLYLEYNDHGLNAQDSLLTVFYVYSYQGGQIENDQKNVLDVDRGKTKVDWKGVSATRLQYDYRKPLTNLSGTYAGTSWAKLGRWSASGQGDRLKMTVLGSNSWTQNPLNSEGAVGETTLFATHGMGNDKVNPNTIAFAYHVGGKPAILEVKLVAVNPPWRDKFDVFIKVTSDARYLAIDYAVSTGFFSPDVVKDAGYPGDTNANIQDVPFEYRVQTGTGSFMLEQNGKMNLVAPVLDGGAIGSTATKFLSVKVNGTNYKIPLI